MRHDLNKAELKFHSFTIWVSYTGAKGFRFWNSFDSKKRKMDYI